MIVLNIFLLIVFFSIIICGLYKNKFSFNKENINLFSKKTEVILLLLIIVFGLFIRIFKFGVVPDGFNQDGAMAVVDGIALAKYKTDRYGMFMPVHLTAWGYGQMSSLLSYLVAIFVSIFGVSITVFRLPILIISLIGGICFYLLIRNIFGKDVSLITLFFLAINPWHIMQSRWILDCNLFPHFLIIGMFLLNKGLKNKCYLYLSMIIFGISMYCYGISIYTVPGLLLIMCIFLKLKKYINIKDIIICVILYLLISWPFILTMIINFLKIETISTPFFTIPYFEHSVRSSDILFFSYNLLKQLFLNFVYLIRVVILQVKDLPWNDIECFGTMYIFSLPLILFGVYLLFKKYKSNDRANIVIIFMLVGIWCGLTTNYVNVNRINIIFYSLILLLSLGFYELLKINKLKWIYLMIYFVVFLVFGYNYFHDYNKSLNEYFFKDFKNAMLYVKDLNYDKLYITTNVQFENSKEVSEILTLFYLEIDSKYYQGKKKLDGLYYDEKYNYINMKYVNELDENCLYVLKINELKYIEETDYNKKCFNDYCVIKSVR